MSLKIQIADALAKLQGLSSTAPTTAGWSLPASVEFEVDFTGVDRMSCSFSELRVRGDALQNGPFDRLKVWADELCRRVTYLLEHIAPLEADSADETVLIRSTPPTRSPDETTFYETVLKAPGLLSLKRYRNTPQNGREAIDMQMTHEVLQKLVQDITDSLPAPTAA